MKRFFTAVTVATALGGSVSAAFAEEKESVISSWLQAQISKCDKSPTDYMKATCLRPVYNTIHKEAISAVAAYRLVSKVDLDDQLLRDEAIENLLESCPVPQGISFSASANQITDKATGCVEFIDSVNNKTALFYKTP